MMATHGADPTSKSWIKACARGAPLLGVLVEAVDAEKAVQA